MNISIYQIRDIANCNYAFRGWESAKKDFGLVKDYESVYSYKFEPNPELSKEQLLEIIFSKFNLHRPADFKGHSLSVSDVVVLDDELYYCDDFGWQKV